MKISLILPVYNPTAGWADLVISKSTDLKSLYPHTDLEVIIVNDGSVNSNYADGKNQLDKDKRLLEYYPNQGKGEALRTGVRASTGDIIIYTDIDFPYTLDSMKSVIDILKEDRADIAIGIKDPDYYAHVPRVRRLISRFLRFLIRIFFRIPTDDTQCGLKGFNQKGKLLFLQTTIKRYLFDLEFIFIGSRHGVRITTRPILLNEGVEFRKMNFGILRNELWNFLSILIRH